MAEATHGSIAPPLVTGLRGYRRPALRRWLGRRSTIAFVMCVPLLAVIVGLVMYPALYAINLSTMNKAMTKHIGLGNFEFLFTRETFWMVVRPSAIFAITAVFFKALIGLITASWPNNIPAKGQRKRPCMLLVPWVMALPSRHLRFSGRL